jgi:hypothetical protein
VFPSGVSAVRAGVPESEVNVTLVPSVGSSSSPGASKTSSSVARIAAKVRARTSIRHQEGGAQTNVAGSADLSLKFFTFRRCPDKTGGSVEVVSR